MLEMEILGNLQFDLVKRFHANELVKEFGIEVVDLVMG